jgi:hypothetical protein
MSRPGLNNHEGTRQLSIGVVSGADAPILFHKLGPYPGRVNLIAVDYGEVGLPRCGSVGCVAIRQHIWLREQLTFER